MRREYHKWFSRTLNRDMELLVFGHAGPRVIVFPTRQGRFYDYENFGMAGSCADRVASGQLQLFCVDSLDSESLYCGGRSPRDRIARHLEFERYVLDEVVPFSGEINPNPRLTAHGCSIGAFHAVNIAFRHPARFDSVIAFSGRYDLTKRMGHFADLFDGYYDEDIYFHMPNHFIPNLNDETLLTALRRMRIVLAIGNEDPFFQSNADLSRALHDRQVPHNIHIWDGEAHRAGAWRRMTRLYLTAE